MSTSCDDDGESPINFESGPKTARIEHECACCSGKIRPGDVYQRVSWLCPETARYEATVRCARCQLLYLELRKLHRDEDIRDDYGEEMGVDPELACGHSFEKIFGRSPPEELARLAFATADEVQAMLHGVHP